MRSSILLLLLSSIILGGCASAYRTGQTPDDVYYSPQRTQDDYVNVKDNDEGRYYGDDQYSDDEYLHMKVQDPEMWSQLDDDWYDYNPVYSYSFFNTLNWNNPWSPYTYWNYYFNPYCSPAYFIPNGAMAYYHPRMFNLNTYNSMLLTSNSYTRPRGVMFNNGFNNNRYNSGVPGSNNSYVPNSRQTRTGDFLRNVFSEGGNTSGGRSSTNFNSGSSGGARSGGGGGGGGASVRRF